MPRAYQLYVCVSKYSQAQNSIRTACNVCRLQTEGHIHSILTLATAAPKIGNISAYELPVRASDLPFAFTLSLSTPAAPSPRICGRV